MAQTTTRVKGVNQMEVRTRGQHIRRTIINTVVFIITTVAIVWMAQVGVYADHKTGISQANAFVFTSWFGHTSSGSAGWIVLVGLILVALLYLFVIVVSNYFWLSTGIMLLGGLIFSTVNYMKILARNEPLQPADFAFVGAGQTGEVMSFLPSAGRDTLKWVIISAGLIIFMTAATMIWVKPRRLFAWRRWQGWLTRGIIAVLAGGMLLYCVNNLDNTDSVVGRAVDSLGDQSRLWDPSSDYRTNGTITAFTRYINPKIMDKPSGYSEATMAELANRYALAADQINQDRQGLIDDQSVIMVLCESCKPPALTPGLTVTPNPTPFLNSLAQTTSSGVMLSTSYGGGTANLEYQALTGMSMGLFSPTLTTPFQQLVPNAAYAPNAMNWWPAAEVVHTYQPNMYSRERVYQQFGADSFWSLYPPNLVPCQERIANDPYISDQCAYDSAIDILQQSDQNQFISLITMQNHAPYGYSYPANRFTVSGEAVSGGSNAEEIATFVQGMSYTDAATKQFLADLDALDRPVTVIWYGDHSPSVYNNDLDNAAQRLKTYETQYFIYSNEAARGHDNKISDVSYSSSNYFMAQVAEQTSSKVSPFLAMLTRLHEQLPALGTSVAAMDPSQVSVEDRQRSAGDLLILDDSGNPKSEADLSVDQQQLLADYRLVQYDITAGSHYVADNGFMDMPK
ncbi:MAG: LTA synthase family protein [Propionibacteriaceae bacterium]|nr:LTA synthase family protein [Propionibacteriaceae bacterium]